MGGLNALQAASTDSNPKYFDNIIKYCNNLSYILLGLAVVVLVQALNDNLLRKKFIRKIVSYCYDIDVEVHGYESRETPFADKMLEEYTEYMDNNKYANLDEYYEGIIKATNTSTRIAYNISVAKNICFTIGLNLFLSVVVLRTVSVYLNSI